MHLILLGLGVAISVGGVVAIGFGIPFKEFGVGNTLIIAGTIALVGGLALAGLASAIGQLMRILHAVEAQTLPRAIGLDPSDHAILAPSPIVSPAPTEPASIVAPPSEVVHPPAPAVSPQPVAPPVAAPDPVGVSPVEPAVPPIPAKEEKFTFDAVWSPPPPSPSPSSSRAPEISVVPPPESTRAPEVSVALSPESAHAPEVSIAPPPVERAPEFAAPPPVVRAPEFVPPPPPPPDKPRASDKVMGDYRADIERADEPAAKEVTVFKSGVIDGMAYTLYSDGSIEAGLPQGTVRFGSIDALRRYLGDRE